MGFYDTDHTQLLISPFLLLDIVFQLPKSNFVSYWTELNADNVFYVMVTAFLSFLVFQFIWSDDSDYNIVWITVSHIEYAKWICNLCYASKLLRNLHLKRNGVQLRDLGYYFNVLWDADCTFKLRLIRWSVQINRTLEHLPEIGTENFLALRRNLKNICAIQNFFLLFLTQVHLICLRRISNQMFFFPAFLTHRIWYHVVVVNTLYRNKNWDTQRTSIISVFYRVVLALWHK